MDAPRSRTPFYPAKGRCSAAIIARTSDAAWVDLNGDKTLDARDAVQSFGVVVAGTRGP